MNNLLDQRVENFIGITHEVHVSFSETYASLRVKVHLGTYDNL